MNIDGGTIAWAALSSALVIAYIVNMRRDPSLNSAKLVKIALVWAAIILGAWFLVSQLTGLS